MKIQQQVNKWLEDKKFEILSAQWIEGYLYGKGIKANISHVSEEESNISFNSFLDWFKEEEVKETLINLVPDSIKIAYFSGDKHNIGILFNKDKQILNFILKDKVYSVNPYDSYFWDIMQCQFIETKFKDIKAGDIYIEYGLNNLNPSNYYLKLEGKEYAKVNIKKNIEVYECGTHKNQNVLKIVVINK